MKIVNLGSLNIDKVYSVPHFVTAGETISSLEYKVFLGGKGLNQSIALARAGSDVYHAGAVGEDGGDLCVLLESNQVNVQFLQNMPGASGHAIIQVTPQGQNCIIISGGSNHRITREYIDNVLSHFNAGDWLLLQNETSEVAYAIKVAKRLGLRVALNPSPITEELLRYPLDMVDVFLFSNKGESTIMIHPIVT